MVDIVLHIATKNIFVGGALCICNKTIILIRKAGIKIAMDNSKKGSASSPLHNCLLAKKYTK